MIRLAGMEDLLTIRQIAEEAFSPFVAVIGKKPVPMVADFERLIDDGVVTLWMSGEEIAGYSVSFQKNEGWHVENLAVASAFQGHGIGAWLMDDVEARARDAGFSVIDLYTNVAMSGALSFYPRLGYTEVSRAKEDGFHRVYFRKVLS